MAKGQIGEILVSEGCCRPSTKRSIEKKTIYPRVMVGDLLALMGYLTTNQLHTALEIQRHEKGKVLPDEKAAIDNTSLHNLVKTQSSLIALLIKKKTFSREELIKMLQDN